MNGERPDWALGFRHILKSRLANTIGVMTALGGGVALVYKLVVDIQGGRGLDHYIAISGREWSPIAAMVFAAIVVTILLVGTVWRWIRR
jgi:hypothetical protein